MAIANLRMLAAARLGVAILAAVALFSAGAHAQTYPARPLTLISPWQPGSPQDGAARIVGLLLQEQLGQPVNVVSRHEGAGLSGHRAIASAVPDGYTIGFFAADAAGTPGCRSPLRHTDFTPVALLSSDATGWRAIAAPRGIDRAVQARLVQGLKRVGESQQFRDAMGQRALGVAWGGPDVVENLIAKACGL